MLDELPVPALGTQMEPAPVPDNKVRVGRGRPVAEMVAHPMSEDEYAIGQRIHNSLMRTLDILGETLAVETAYVHFKNGILTVDLLTSQDTRRRIILGADNRATFMDYTTSSIYGRKITMPPHFADNATERNLETILLQTKQFAVEAQLPVRMF